MSKLNLAQRILQVYKEVKSVIKDDHVSTGEGKKGYMAVSHDAVTSALHGPMAAAGIIINVTQKDFKLESFEKVKIYNGVQQSTTWYLVELKILCTFINVDDPNEQLLSESYGYALDTGDKAVGKALSMALKNTLLKNFMLESLDEEEQRTFENEPPMHPQKEYTPPKKPVDKKPLPNLALPDTPPSPDELVKLTTLGLTAGWSREQLGGFTRSVFKVKNSGELTRSQFQSFKKVLESKKTYDQAIFEAQEMPS